MVEGLVDVKEEAASLAVATPYEDLKMRAPSHFPNVFVAEVATLYVSMTFVLASVTHSECSNVDVDAVLQSSISEATMLEGLDQVS